jgi:hypothetical protein
MAKINVYDVPEKTYETFKKLAAREQRSVTRQVLYMIEQAAAEFASQEAEQCRTT